MTAAPALEARHLSLRFGAVLAIEDLSFEVEPSKLFAIIGPNGAGKTSLLNMLSRTYRPTSGELHLHGTDMLKLRAHQLTGAGVALGAIYALVALGFTVVFKASWVINFAQGEMLAFGAFLTSWLVLSGHLPFWAAFLLGVAVTAGLGLAFQSVVLRVAIGRPDFTVVMLTLGLATILTSVIPTMFGSNPRAAAVQIPSRPSLPAMADRCSPCSVDPSSPYWVSAVR